MSEQGSSGDPTSYKNTIFGDLFTKANKAGIILTSEICLLFDRCYFHCT